MAVSSSNGGLGLLTEDLAEAAVGGRMGVAAGKDSSEGSWGDRSEGGSETVVFGSSSFPICVTSASCINSGGLGATVSEVEPPGVGSGKHSRFDFSQRGQTQFLDLGSERGVGEQPLKSWVSDVQSS